VRLSTCWIWISIRTSMFHQITSISGLISNSNRELRQRSVVPGGEKSLPSRHRGGWWPPVNDGRNRSQRYGWLCHHYLAGERSAGDYRRGHEEGSHLDRSRGEARFGPLPATGLSR